MHVLGIDAGGTKTVCQLADERGAVVAEARGGGANLRAAGQIEVERVLRRLIEDVLAHREIRPEAICIGIAGADRERDADLVRDVTRRLGHDVPTVVVNDALIALVAGVGERAGVVIVAGTGSIAYGRDAAGRAARAGGWGYLLGDEGGGFWIGRAALSAVVRQFDRRGPATLLTELVLTQMGLTTPAQVIAAVYDRGLPRHVIAGIADVVEHATGAGDAVAAEILDRAADELTSAAASVVTKLEMRGEVFQTVLAGGIFRGIPSLAASVEARLAEVAPRSIVRRLEVEPAYGAVRLALAATRGRVVIPSYI
ncbi:MAG TPA: BadF/BadG/BcrA/BcrD ATPase family protein [Vicinamibacterales bacterium]|nr:BadF/BadG/BcrA/BcrD ATPase family protein [Vicinamibacterales bacterium]